MSRILFVFGTTDGHTATVVATAAEALRTDGESVDVVEVRSSGPGPRPEEYDAVLVAASVHAGGYQRAVFRWVREHAAALNGMPTAFFTVCLAVLEDNPRSQKDLAGIVQRFVVKTGWRPNRRKYIAGALLYTKYGWVKRFIMKRIATKTGGGTDTSRDYVYTDWDDLRAAVRAFAADLHAAAPKTSTATP